jgi:hypothetical protein
MTGFAETIKREVTSWEGVTVRRGASASGGEAEGRDSGTLEFRFGRHVLGALPLAGLVDERAIIQRMRDAYERAQDALDRSAGVGA